MSRPALMFAQAFAENAGMIDGALRVLDTVVAKVLQRNPRIIRRHIRRYHRRNRLGPMLTTHTASGRLAYLLTGAEMHDFVFFEQGPIAMAHHVDTSIMLADALSGKVVSINPRAREAVQQIAEFLEPFRAPPDVQRQLDMFDD